MSTMTVEEELAQFDRDYNPSGGRRPGLDMLADGNYDFEIVSASLDRTERTNDLIFRLGLKVLATGQACESVYFFASQQNVDILGSDLTSLGLDADQWKPPTRPFSREIVAACPKLVGIHFRAKKVTKPGRDGKTFHNLQSISRLAGNAASSVSPPPPYTPNMFNEPAATGAAVTPDDIPF